MTNAIYPFAGGSVRPRTPVGCCPACRLCGLLSTLTHGFMPSRYKRTVHDLNAYMKALIRRRWAERQARLAAGEEMESPDILERVLASLDPAEFGEVSQDALVDCGGDVELRFFLNLTPVTPPPTYALTLTYTHARAYARSRTHKLLKHGWHRPHRPIVTLKQAYIWVGFLEGW